MFNRPTLLAAFCALSVLDLTTALHHRRFTGRELIAREENATTTKICQQQFPANHYIGSCMDAPNSFWCLGCADLNEANVKHDGVLHGLPSCVDDGQLKNLCGQCNIQNCKNANEVNGSPPGAPPAKDNGSPAGAPPAKDNGSPAGAPPPKDNGSPSGAPPGNDNGAPPGAPPADGNGPPSGASPAPDHGAAAGAPSSKGDSKEDDKPKKADDSKKGGDDSSPPS